MKQKELLLLEDVVGLGRKGELVSNMKPGYVRNYLLPQQKAVIADKRTLRMQERLKAERAAQAASDRKASEEIKAKIDGKSFEVTVKVDPEGHLYGSVSTADVQALLEQEGVLVERHMIRIGGAIKKLGTHNVPLKLKEDVTAAVTLKILPDHPIEEKKEEATKSEKEEPSEG
ncbi:MAG: 50S ribosomal protein L9 [Candidatus Algichlamydia australiensis]|nr:50S ribosomal protein L9 [Chlamydiales bacterium]